MFTFMGSVHLAILRYQHHNNIHNNNDSKNINTVFATHTQKKLFLLPTPRKVALYVTILYPTLQAIYTIQR